MTNPNPNRYFVAIHLGAGSHPYSRKENLQFQHLCNKSCTKALNIMANGGSASDAVVAAIIEIESSGLCNAGNGSVLNLSKEVELDAGFMDGEGYFGGVGGLPCVKNPILVAKKLADLQIGNNFQKDRIPPIFLVGNEATNFAKNNGIEVCNKEDLISDKSKRFYEKHLKSTEELIASDPEHDMVSDTIGAVAFDGQGNVASGVSSGGIWFKVPGRVGHSPIFGSGCYSTNGDEDLETSSIAISTTGCGEMLSKTRFAYEFATAIKNEQLKDEEDETLKCPAEILPELIKTNFFKSPLLKNHKEPKLLGMISLEWNRNRDFGEFISFHTSQNFIFAYGCEKSDRIRVQFSSLDSGKKPGKSYRLHAIPI